VSGSADYFDNVMTEFIINNRTDERTDETDVNLFSTITNSPLSIYQYSNMAPRLSGQTSIFGVVSFVSKSLLGIERQKKHEKFAILTRKARTHFRILIYRTWPIVKFPL